MRTLEQMNKILKDETGRFKSKVLQRIADESEQPYHRVANVMHQRKIANNDPVIKLNIYKAADKICDNEEGIAEQVRKIELSTEDVQLIFRSLKTPFGTNPAVSTSFTEGDIEVWYEGADEDLELRIEVNDMIDHVKSYDLNRYQVGLDNTHVYDLTTWIEDNLDQCSIHYIRNNKNFEIC